MLWLLLGLLVLSLAGCAPAEQAVQIEVQVSPQPPAVGPAHLQIQLLDSGGHPLAAEKVSLEAAMSGPEMPPVKALARPAGDGRYEAPFRWSMPGQWTLTVAAVLSGGQTVTRQVNLDVAPADNQSAANRVLVPNHGAAIHLESPPDGAVFAAGQVVPVRVSVENFTLGEDGNHWHVYVDGQPQRMIMGNILTAELPDLPPGEHTISVYLSNGEHADLAEGDSVRIEIAEPAAGGN